MTAQLRSLHIQINARGYREQEKALLFPALYGNGHVLTRRFEGRAQEFDNAYRRGKFEVY